MSNPFESRLGSLNEEDFDDAPVANAAFDGTRQIKLIYGTEQIEVDMTNTSNAGRTLAQIASMNSAQLGFSREASRLNYRVGGSFVESSTIPKPGTTYVLSTSADTKGDAAKTEETEA